jgi:glycosyltransferase involved in cell wall biosynthesis
MKLTIVIPVFNEEHALPVVLQNALEARPEIGKGTPFESVEILVVDDGSSDRSAEIVRTYPEVSLVQHAKNSGYGAAVKTGFRAAQGHFVACLDGDGTHDAKEFALLGRQLEGIDLMLGTRLGNGSRMPKVRRLGNRIFAALASVLSGKKVTDIGTGMRIYRKSLIDQVPSLPDGFHFTPAFTCHALQLPGVRVIERPITYVERVGKSKLRVVKDGIRWLKSILGASVYRWQKSL